MNAKKPKNVQIKNFIGQIVEVYAAASKYAGTLMACDSHMNLALKDCVETAGNDAKPRALGLVLLRGEQVNLVVPTGMRAAAAEVSAKPVAETQE